jgi:hypothetical protein
MKSLYIAFLLFVAAFWTGCGSADVGHWKLPEDLKIQIHLKGDFVLKSEKQSDNKKRRVFEYNENVLSIQEYANTENSKAQKIVADKRFLLDNLFLEQPSPYPGKFSNTIGCPDELKPVFFEKKSEEGWRQAYTINANNRKVYGDCSESSIYYNSAYIFYYCEKEQALFEIKYFTPKSDPFNDLEGIIESVKCG